jgi:hypothetical protein
VCERHVCRQCSAVDDVEGMLGQCSTTLQCSHNYQRPGVCGTCSHTCSSMTTPWMSPRSRCLSRRMPRYLYFSYFHRLRPNKSSCVCRNSQTAMPSWRRMRSLALEATSVLPILINKVCFLIYLFRAEGTPAETPENPLLQSAQCPTKTIM